jgi:hypothetical protein
VIITVIVIVIALIFIWYQIKGPSIPEAAPQMAYYTTDDGKTYFAEDQMKDTPFDHNGQKAVRAWLYTCGDSKDKKLLYLEQYTPMFQKQLADAKAKNQPMDPMIIAEQGDAIYEVRKPGQKNWILKSSAAGQKMITPPCPPGKNPNWAIPPMSAKPGDPLS